MIKPINTWFQFFDIWDNRHIYIELFFLLIISLSVYFHCSMLDFILKNEGHYIQ